MERGRARLREALDQGEAWVGQTGRRRQAFDLATALHDRDREAFASVLGSAIALRLFLFTAALVVFLVTALNLALGDWGLGSALDSAGVAGELADEIDRAADANTGRDVGLVLSSFVLALWAGRSLTTVLAACSAGAWRVHAREARASVGVIVRVTALVALFVVAASALNRLRESFGIAVATGSLAVNLAILGIGWFLVTLALPKPTRDPGAMLPGAVAFGVVVTAVQWFMHYYLPVKVANASQTMGSIGVTVASLGYLFLIGRVMAATLVLNAVLWERLGSVSAFAFGLPGVRRIPVRFPAVARFFDLHPSPPSGEAGPPP